ncbi:unnamed protein product, partial [Symbiodinium sp. CCMP2456]
LPALHGPRASQAFVRGWWEGRQGGGARQKRRRWQRRREGAAGGKRRWWQRSWEGQGQATRERREGTAVRERGRAGGGGRQRSWKGAGRDDG